MQQREPIPDGVYLDMPIDQYVLDRALSSSGFAKLENNPPDWWWQHPDNVLWEPPELSSAYDLGEMIHAAVVEGLAVYKSRFTPPPDRAQLERDGVRVLDTATDMSAWIKERNAALAKAGVTHAVTGKQLRLNISGLKADIAQRIREHCDEFKGIEEFADAPAFWDDLLAEHLKGRQLVRSKDDATVQLLAVLVRSDPVLSKLLSDGVPELSIFWTDDGVRLKARTDLLKQAAIVEVKSFGRVSPRGLLRGFLADRVAHGDHVQAVHQMHAVEQIKRLDVIDMKQGVTPDENRERIKRLEQITEGDKVFVWLGLYTAGGPTSLAVRFDRDTIPWVAAAERIKDAVARFRDYTQRFGPAVWIRSEGLITPDIMDWPSYVTDPAT